MVSASMTPLISVWRSGCLLGGCLHGLDFELDFDAVAHQHAARLQHLVPAKAEVLAIELSASHEADALVAPRILGAPAILDVERDAARHAAYGEVTDQPVAILRQLFDAPALEAQLRELLDVEKVGRAQVVVALLRSRVDARSVDGRLHGRARQVVFIELDGAAVLDEAAAHLRHDHVPD